LITKNENKGVFCSIILIVFLMITQSGIAISEIKPIPKVSEGSISVSTKPSVGVYYYPWYHDSKYQWRRAMRLHLKNPQEPKSGYYDSSDPKVIADHIEQSIRGGISFWAVSWWGPNDQKDRIF
jgi:hypothetical protein